MTKKQAYLFNNYKKYPLSTVQANDIEQLLNSWIEYGPVGYGQFDFMDLIAKNRGWNPLVLYETMEVTIGSKVYKITREE